MHLPSFSLALLPFLLFLPITIGYKTYPITGADGFGTHPRLEIRTLYEENPAQWNIYLLALRAFYAEAEHEKLSYFQIAGIHGYPNIAWDGARNTTANGVGYCSHTSNIFVTWHRPYVALFEQRLQQLAMQEARKFKGQDQVKYVAAAKTLRAAYWDWAIDPAVGEPVLPPILTDRTMSVYTPNGHEVIQNPFYEYRFHPTSTKSFVKEPWTFWNRTLRYPATKSSNASSIELNAVKGIESQFKFVQKDVFRWFSNCPTWLEIDGLGKTSKHCLDLEDIHGTIHLFVGGAYGHMAHLKYAGFDPIFWLHHSNVDRLFAMWQAIHPKEYVVKFPNALPTFTYKKSQVLDENTPLAPFHSDEKGTFWTSAQIRDHKVFHYTYPELMNGGSTPAAMRKQINELYGPNATRHAAGGQPGQRRRSENVNLRSQIFADRSTNSPFLANNGSIFQYFASIETTRYGLGGSYGVYLFFGDPVFNDSSSWLFDPNLAGTYQVLSTPGSEDINLVATGEVSLTDALNEQVRNGNITTMTEEFVVPFLSRSLQWRVVGPTGFVLDPASVPSFNLKVGASTLLPNADPTEFPVWSPLVPLSEITRGKPGGAGL